MDRACLKNYAYVSVIKIIVLTKNWMLLIHVFKIGYLPLSVAPASSVERGLRTFWAVNRIGLP